jgi:hypothetical protein
MKKVIYRPLMKIFVALLPLLLLIPGETVAQNEDVYESGSVWNITFVRTHANAGEKYLQGINQTWKAAMDEFVKEGLIESYKILYGDASNEDDFDIMLLMEFKNYAAFDPNPERDKKFDSVQAKLKEAMGEKWDETVASYATMRDILGTKSMREIYLK